MSRMIFVEMNMCGPDAARWHFSIRDGRLDH